MQRGDKANNPDREGLVKVDVTTVPCPWKKSVSVLASDRRVPQPQGEGCARATGDGSVDPVSAD